MGQTSDSKNPNRKGVSTPGPSPGHSPRTVDLDTVSETTQSHGFSYTMARLQAQEQLLQTLVRDVKELQADIPRHVAKLRELIDTKIRGIPDLQRGANSTRADLTRLEESTHHLQIRVDT